MSHAISPTYRRHFVFAGAGGTPLPGIDKAGGLNQQVLTAVEYVGKVVRVERASNGALFVWERQSIGIEATIEQMLE